MSMNSAHVKYLLVGGGIASSAATAAIRQRDPEGSILLVGQEVHRPYHRPPLSGPYLIDSGVHRPTFAKDDWWFAGQRVVLQTGRRATRLDTARGAVAFDNGEEINFDHLLIATGASPKRLTIPGTELPGVYYLRTIEDADRLRHAMAQAQREGRSHARGRGRAGIVGVGLLGVELAAALTRMGLAVELAAPVPHPWEKFAGEATGRLVARRLESAGVQLHLPAAPLRLEGDGRVQRMVLSNGQTVAVDFVIAAIGIAPNIALLRGTSIAGERTILVDDHCRTSIPGIFAAGDCAAIYDPTFDKYRLMEHWESAAAMGAVAGDNMAGGNEAYAQGNHFTSQAMGLSLAVWGEARAVERRIIRGNVGIEAPDFIEIGVAADGRVAQIVAINHGGEDAILRDMVLRRVNITDKESQLRDPAVNLAAMVHA
jgi:3-phenylpropionate/trans-cinnamate dioxygenase ferredoxin reductase subunit